MGTHGLIQQWPDCIGEIRFTIVNDVLRHVRADSGAAGVKEKSLFGTWTERFDTWWSHRNFGDQESERCLPRYYKFTQFNLTTTAVTNSPPPRLLVIAPSIPGQFQLQLIGHVRPE